MVETAIVKADILIEALPYIRSFRRKFVVVKIGGSLLEDETALNSVITDVVFMEQVGMWPVVVHGGGKHISGAMAEAGLEPRFIEGKRYTDEKTLEIVQKVLIDRLSKDITRRMRNAGGQAIPLNGRDSSFLTGRRAGGTPDLGLVGEITGVDAELCARLCDGGLVPVVAPIASSPDGGLLNVNADDCALAVAITLDAAKLVMVSDVEGIYGPEGKLVSSMDAAGARELIESGVITGGMLPKVRSCLEAVEKGVRKVHIVSGKLKHALLLEIFTDRGVGTEILP